MKKKMAMILSAAMVIGSVSVFPATAFADGNEDVSGSILIWEHDYSVEDALISVIEGFEEQYPNVDVDYEIKADGDYYSLLQTAVQSGSGPDLFWTHGNATSTMADYVDNGVLKDLTDAVDFSNISDAAMELSLIDGKAYSVPWLTMDTRAVFYNKDMFEEHGWSIPTTFTEFEELLAAIKETGITPVSLAYDPWTLLFVYEPVLSGYDPDYTAALREYTDVTATDAPAREAMQKLVDWSDAGYFGDNWFGVVENSSQILAFTTGNAAMNIAGSWDASTISMNNPALNFGAFEIPSEDGVTGLVGTSANGFSVSANATDMDAALAFANYCATLDAQTRWVQGVGAVSASTEIEASSEVANEITAAGQGNTYRSWQNCLSSYSEGGSASVIWEQDFTKIFDGEMSVDEFMDEIASEMK